MRVYLVGFMGVGKSTVGETLARRLGVGFVDLDREVERSAGASIPEIFDRGGEAEFRRLESAALAATHQLADGVIALGGGALTAPENRRVTAGGTTVWLDLPLADILERLGPAAGAHRPLLRDRRRAARLYAERRAGYRDADLRIDLQPDEPPAQIAARIAHLLREHPPCAT